MKKITGLLFSFLVLLSSCQQDSNIEDLLQKSQTRSLSENNTFTFFDSFIVWNSETYMLDYAILAIDNPPLDATITIPYVIFTDKGYRIEESFVIKAGSTGYWEEGTTLGEAIIKNVGMDPYNQIITSVLVGTYQYSGNMEIVGLDNLNVIPPGIMSSDMSK